MITAVTGATGHLGYPTVRELLLKGHEVRVLKRRTSNFESFKNIDVESRVIDLNDNNSLSKALQGVNVLIHMASKISVMPLMKRQLVQTNVIGTNNILNAAISQKVERFVYVGSIHSIPGPGKNKPLDENIKIDERHVSGDYGYTKALATNLVLEAGKSSRIETLAICPTGLVGPFDVGTSHMGTVIKNYIDGKFPFFINGGYDFIDVREVAKVLAKSVTHGLNAQHYILGGHYLGIKELFGYLSDLTDVQYPQFAIPLSVARFLSYPNAYIHRLLGMSTLFTPDSISTLRQNANISKRLAFSTFKVPTIPWKESITDQVSWYKDGKF